jgi:uncharacterized membrane protein YgdD (TMEM256/DUF423 family)
MRYLEFLPARLRILAEPFELFLGLAALLSGLSVLLGATHPTALQTQVSPWVLRAWGAALLSGGSLTLVSRWLIAVATTDDRLETAARLERLGMILFSTTAAMYGAAIVAVGRTGLTAGPLILGWSVACATRAWIITQEWKAYEDARTLRRNTG